MGSIQHDREVAGRIGQAAGQSYGMEKTESKGGAAEFIRDWAKLNQDTLASLINQYAAAYSKMTGIPPNECVLLVDNSQPGKIEYRFVPKQWLAQFVIMNNDEPVCIMPVGASPSQAAEVAKKIREDILNSTAGQFGIRQFVRAVQVTGWMPPEMKPAIELVERREAESADRSCPALQWDRAPQTPPAND